jgi:hypothetical protein
MKSGREGRDRMLFSLLACLAIAYYLALYSVQMFHLFLGYRAALYWKKLGYEAESSRLYRSDLVPPISLVNELSFMDDPGRWVDQLFSEHFPELELLIMYGDAEERRAQELVKTYFLRRVDRVYRRSIRSAQPLEVFQSDDRRLSLVHTEAIPRGARLNLAINMSRYPLLGVAGDRIELERDVLIRMVRPFMEGSARVPVVMGMELPLEMEADNLLPARRITRYCLMESLRIQLGYFSGASSLGGPVTCYSPLMLFRKKDLVEAGGFDAAMPAVKAEMDMLLRLHRSLLGQKTDYRLVYLPQAVARRPFPEKWRDHVLELRARRENISAVLWAEKDMVFKPRFRRLGMLDLPAYWLFVKLMPLLGFCAYAAVITFFALGRITWPIFAGFLVSSMAYPALVGVGAVIAARRELGILKGQGGLLYGYAFMTQVWFRQLSNLAPIVSGRFLRERRVESA